MGLLDEAIREHLALKRGRGADPAEIARQEKEALGPPTRAEAPARDPGGESGEAALDEPATAFAPDDDAPPADREPSEPRLRLADEPIERDEPPEIDEPPEPPELDEPPQRDEPAELDEPQLEPPARLRVTEEELREGMPGEDAPPPPPVAPVDEAPAVHEEPLAPVPAPADEDALLDLADDEPHTDDFIFDDEDDDFLADEFDELGAGEPAPLDQPTQQYALEDVEDATRPPEPPPPTPESGEEDEPEEDEPEGEELLEETPEFLEETPEHDRLWFEQKPPRDFDF